MSGPEDIHPLLRQRWSPRAFDPAHQVTAAQVELLVEAARWAPSAGNSQPWAFVTGLRGDATHRRIVRYLARSAAEWAPRASVLMLNLCHRFVDGTDWEYSEFAQYDLGQAVAHLSVQAQSLGLSVRQIRAFDRHGLEAEFLIAREWQLTTMSAIGLPVDLARDGETRRTLDDVHWRA
jgi:nitroreductase